MKNFSNFFYERNFMPCKNNTNLAKTSVNRLFIAKNSRRKYFRREFCRLYNTRSGYWKKLVPVIGKTIRHQVPQNAVLIMPKTNPATANPAQRVRVFICTTPTILNASPAALSSKRKNITVVFQKTLIEQRKINKLTQKQVAEYPGITQPSISAPKTDNPNRL